MSEMQKILDKINELGRHVDTKTEEVKTELSEIKAILEAMNKNPGSHGFTNKTVNK